MDKVDKIFSELGPRLRKVRTEKRLTQKEVANAMQVRPNQYGKVENGKVVPSLKTLVKAAEALSVSLDELVFGDKTKTDENMIKDSQMADRIRTINNLSGEDKMIALHLLDLIVVKTKFKDIVKDVYTLHP